MSVVSFKKLANGIYIVYLPIGNVVGQGILFEDLGFVAKHLYYRLDLFLECIYF